MKQNSYGITKKEELEFNLRIFGIEFMHVQGAQLELISKTRKGRDERGDFICKKNNEMNKIYPSEFGYRIMATEGKRRLVPE